MMTKSVFNLLLIAGVIFSACKKDDVELNNNLNTNNNNNDTIKDFFHSDSLRINEIQLIGSHNSYRLKTYEPIFDFVQSIGSLLPSGLNPDGWDYEHLPLEQQFGDYGIRKIELDIYHDPDGGRFYNRMGNQLVNEPVESGIAELNEPGFKVLHIADVDYMTHYITFKQSLQALKNWSDANHRHLPIFVLIETKTTSLSGLVPFYTWTDALPFDVSAMNAIDDEIRAVFGSTLERVITPDVVRGNFATLKEAVNTRGWTKIAEARGKVVFLLNNDGSVKENYLQGHPSLQGRIMFVNSGDNQPESAFIMENNPSSSNIERWVSEGYIVRTRADSNTDEARTNDVSKRDRAFASGAQLISTDYYRPDPRHLTDPGWTDYSVRFPGGAAARLNPINGPANFKGDTIE